MSIQWSPNPTRLFHKLYSLMEVSLKRWTGSLSKTGVGSNYCSGWSHYTLSINGRDEDFNSFFFLIDKSDLWMSQQKSPKPPRELKGTRCDNAKHWKFSFRESFSPSGRMRVGVVSLQYPASAIRARCCALEWNECSRRRKSKSQFFSCEKCGELCWVCVWVRVRTRIVITSHKQRIYWSIFRICVQLFCGRWKQIQHGRDGCFFVMPIKSWLICRAGRNVIVKNYKKVAERVNRWRTNFFVQHGSMIPM